MPAEYTLPDEYEESVAEEIIQAPEVFETQIFESSADEDGIVLGAVDGFMNWRKVDRGEDLPYYFHVITQETRWDPPTSNE